MSADEKKNKTIGIAFSVGIHALLLAIFFFVLAWKEPDPPLPEYGIELNFGMEQVGSGEAPKPQKTEVIEEEPEEQIDEPEEVEEVVEEPEPVVPEPVEEVVEEPTEVQPEESPAPVEEVAKPEPQTIAKEEPKEEKPVVQKEVKEVPEEPKASANQGDDVDKAGDKGEEEGEIDARAIYGAKGSDKGASLQMTGWNWDYIPRPNDQSSESGKIVFQITIDSDGYVIRVVTLESTVSPAVERIYRQEIERLTFSRTADNLKPAPTSAGKITFIIKAR